MYGPVVLVILAYSTLINATPLALLESNTKTFKGSSVLDKVPLVDGHNDFPYNLYAVENNEINGFNFDSDLKSNPKWSEIKSSFTDLPRLRKGKIGGQFWVAYVGCHGLDKDAVELTLDQIDVIRRLIKAYPDDLQLTTTAEGIWSAFENKKIASMIGVEGGHSIDNRLGVLRLYYELGVRYMTLTHTCTLPWADASPVDDSEVPKRDLTDYGKKVVKEMNRLGMLVDLSHVSKGVMVNALNVSKAPVMFSHSNAYTIHPHHRNVQDDVLKELQRNGGIIMVNFYPGFLGGTSIEKVIEHLNYIKNLIGVDYVGIGSDYDGISEVAGGLDDVSKYPLLFDRLAEPGHGYEPWTEKELQKLAGLNLIRVFREVEKVSQSLKNQPIFEDRIPYDELTRDNRNQSCRSDLEKYKKSSHLEQDEEL